MHTALIAIVAATLVAPALAAIPLEAEPSWESTDDDYATGGMLWDLDGDGYLDLVVGNGNDMDEEYDAVFYNHRGVLEREASWRSSDLGYDGHLDMGDVDADGDLDAVVTGFLAPEREQLYRNDDGRLTPAPVWMNEERDNSFACALGDVDGDGDLDLATVSGYFDSGPVLVYANDGGALRRTASWRTPVSYDFNDVGWCDVDGDGDLDLAAAGHGIPCYLFENARGVLNTRPVWWSAAVGEYNQLTFGDVDGDGWRDMVVSDNLLGRVELYRNVGGTLQADYSWSAPVRYASCVKLADVDADGDLDLAAGGWWSPIQVFENVAGEFGASPGWWYYPGLLALVCEQAVWGDADNDGLRFVAAERYDGDSARKLWYLAHAPLHAFAYARVDGRTLELDEYCYHPEEAWVSLARAPRAGTANVEFGYVYSTDLELVVTNWDEPGGNYLFDNTRGRAVEISGFGVFPGNYGLVLKWTVTAGAAKLAGFNAYRHRVDVGSRAAPIVKVNEGLITAAGASFAFEDGDVAEGGTYDYWLEAALRAGGFETFGPSRGYARKAAFALGQSYPNPTRGLATIPFSLEAGGDVALRLYDLAGRRVATLYEGFARAGGHLVPADASALAPGIYVYLLTTPEGEAAGKMVVAP